MNCAYTKENLSAYIDKMLDAEQTETIQKHLSNCAECAQEFNELSEVISCLSKIQSVPLPASFDDRLHKALQEEKAALQAADETVVLQTANEKAKKPMNFKRKLAMTSSVAAVLVIGIFSITMFNNMGNDMANNNMPEPITMAGGIADEFSRFYQMNDRAADVMPPEIGNFGVMPSREVLPESEAELMVNQDADEMTGQVSDPRTLGYLERNLRLDTDIVYGGEESFAEVDSCDALWAFSQSQGTMPPLTVDCAEYANYLELIGEFLGDVDFAITKYYFDERRGVHVFHIQVTNEVNQAVELFILHGQNGEVRYATD